MCEFEFNAATCGVGIDTTNRQTLHIGMYIQNTHVAYIIADREREREHSLIHCNMCRVFVLFGAAGERGA
jgi:hypothetical protein